MRGAVTVALGAAAALLAACSGDDAAPAVSDAAPPSSTAPATTIRPATTAAASTAAPGTTATPASTTASSPPGGPTEDLDWPVSTPEANGVDAAALAAALVAIRDEVPHVHSVTIARHGSLFVDAYYAPYDGSTPHDVASVTKSITTTLVGIAAARGELALDDPVLSFFPDREVAHRDARKERMTVEHLLTMATGFACAAEPDEPTLAAMEDSDDYVQFALDLPMAAEPGAAFSYCSPGMHLLSAILTEATGSTELDYAERVLFGPLGFGTVYWPTDAQGYSHGWGDAVIHPRDLAKLGQLFLDRGRWAGEQVVPRAWVDAAAQVHADTGDPGTGYGFGWWVERDPAAGGEFGAVGRGGQYVTVMPAIDTVLVVTGGAGDFDDADVLDRIAAAIVDVNSPLPANRRADRELAATLDALQAPPAAQPFSLPPEAAEISGATFEFTPGNPLGVASLRLTFDGSAVADAEITFVGARPAFAGPIGLDGVLRTAPGTWGLPAGMRGGWTDGTTFTFERDEIANNGALVTTLRFGRDGVAMDVQERTVEGTITIRGTRSATG